MNTIFIALAEIFLGLLISVLIIYTSFRIFAKFLSIKLNDIYQNRALAILMVGFIFSIGYILLNVIRPTMMTVEILSRSELPFFDLLIKTVLYLLLFIVICLVIGLFVTFFAFKLFDLLTKGIKEQDEIIKNGNVSVAIVIAGIIVTVTMLVNPSIELLIESLVPSPTLSF